MPPPPKHPALKAIAGTTRKDRGAQDDTVQYAVMEILPPPPDWMTNPHAIAEWRRLGPPLLKQRMLTDVSITALANLCAIHGVMVESWIAGRMPHPSVISQFRQLTNDFGLTPLAQGRVKQPGAGDKPANPFNRNGQRNAA